MELKTNINVSFVPVGQVSLNDYNPKDALTENPENKAEYEKLVKNILDHGFTEAIEVRQIGKNKYEVIDGQHRFLALKELGAKEVPINNLGEMSREEAMTRTLNKDLIKIPLNDMKLAKLLAEISEAGRKRLPFTDEEVAERLAMLTFDWDKFMQNDIEFEEKKNTENSVTFRVDEETFNKLSELMKNAEAGEHEINVRKVYKIGLTSAVYRAFALWADAKKKEGIKGDDLVTTILDKMV